MPLNSLDLLEREFFPKWVYVLTSAHDGRCGGMTVSWVTRMSGRPLLMMVAVHGRSYTGRLIRASQRYAINVLHDDQTTVARSLGLHSGWRKNKLADIAVRMSPLGLPLLVDAMAYLECVVRYTGNWGDHDCFVGEAVSGEHLRYGSPLRYSAEVFEHKRTGDDR